MFIIFIPVSANAAISRVEVVAPVSRFTPGSSYQFEYRITPSNETVSSANWSVSGSGASITSSGKLTLSGSAKGAVTVTVTVRDSSGRSSKGMLTFVIKGETTTKRQETTTKRHETTTERKETTTRRSENNTTKQETTRAETTTQSESTTAETTTTPSTTTTLPSTAEETTTEIIPSNEVMVASKKGETIFEWNNENKSLTNLFLSNDGGENFYLIYSGFDEQYTSKTLKPNTDYIARIVMQDSPQFKDSNFTTESKPISAGQVVLISVLGIMFVGCSAGAIVIGLRYNKKTKSKE